MSSIISLEQIELFFRFDTLLFQIEDILNDLSIAQFECGNFGIIFDEMSSNPFEDLDDDLTLIGQDEFIDDITLVNLDEFDEDFDNMLNILTMRTPSPDLWFLQ